MIEIISTFARWSQLTANLILFGCFIFLAIAGQPKIFFKTSWATRLEKGFPWMAGVVLLGLLGVLATTAGEATGVAANAWSPAAWFGIVQQTWVGRMWAAQALLAAVLLGVILYTRRVYRSRWHYVVCAVAASLPLIAGSFVSHSGAEEISIVSIAPYSLHILMAGVWLGGLPAFLYVVYDNSHRKTDKASHLLNTISLRKFSAIALPVMLGIIVTGLIVADRMIEEDYHALVSSSYGWLLTFKLVVLAVILLIAYQVRYKWFPLFSGVDKLERIEQGSGYLKKWVGIEFILALLLMVLATMLAYTVPAKHALIENWPYPFRFSVKATWDEPNVQVLFWSGAMLFIVALGMGWLGIKNSWDIKKRSLIPGVLAVVGLAIALPPLAIEAYPETYRKTPVPFDAISISNGSVLFAEHCASCHGPQGKGNGVHAGNLSSEPTDLLTEPHTARHTAGNFFHWVSHGVPNTDMPSFSAVLSEESRWDIVNYLHAMSRGFVARLLGSMIYPEKPAIGPPTFSYFAYDGSGGDLKDFRQNKNVLLVLFSWPQSRERLHQLKDAYAELNLTFNTEIMLVPMRPLDEEELLEVAASAPFPVVTEGSQEISSSYLLFRRTRAVPDLLGKGLIPGHIEYMIDRFGYLRARWVSQFDGFGWLSLKALTLQLSLLNQEDEIMPPPGDHVH